jgi:hypothetical protein
VEILTGLSDYGNIQNFLGQPGMHEFMIVLSVNTGTGEIIFRNDFLKTYNPQGNVQVVRVPYYNSATVTGTLYCAPWDNTTKKGGVLALIIGRTLKLEADIDVSGSGFIGGNDMIGDGRCSQTAPQTLNLSYPLGFTNAGFKGEGIAIHNETGVLLAPTNVKGKGPNFTGGGGGNGRFSGGGGGSNRGAGGIGGFEDNVCPGPQEGGLGGIKSESLSFPSLSDRIYFGGGGGASTSLTGISQPGGNGGGIIIIITDTIIGNSHKIISNGGNGGTAVANGGSGGGGAGGSVALSLTSFKTSLTISVSGGNGGDNPGGFGEGGGGGGGLLYVPLVPPANVQVLKDGGKQGNFSNPPSNPGLPGDPGDSKPGFIAVLNGFLFNSVRSSFTGNQIDSVCSNLIPPKITGTVPVGGTGPYTYLWEKSYNLTAWISLGNDADPTNYTPSVIESQTVWFRRTITDSSIPTVLVDISKPVQIIVQPVITGNLVGKDTTICFNQNPQNLIPLNAGPSNGSSHNYYLYKWIQNNTNSNWNTSPTATGNAHLASYDPPSLSATTYYQRVVTSGRCTNFSSSVKITVLSSITGNKIIKSDSIICQGSSFVALGASAPGQGEIGNYRYQWQDSIASSVWNPAAGSNTGAGYTPDTSKFSVTTQSRFYRRLVSSGPYDVCRSKSSQILLTKYPKIKNNLIPANLADLTICSGSVPVALPGSSPSDGAGNGSYTYIWQQSANGSLFSSAAGVNNSASGNYQAPALTDTTWYRRIVNSGIYKSTVVCTNTSQSIRINVHKPILNNNIALTGGGTLQTICNNQKPYGLLGTAPTGGTNIPGNFAYLWKYSTDNLTFNPIPGVVTTSDYSPSNLNVTTYYRRDASSGACTVSSNSVAVTVLPSITNNTLSGNPKVCFGRIPDLITGATLSGGSGAYNYSWQQSTDGGTQWVPATGTNSSSNYQSPALSVPTKYRRYVTSGLNDCCTSTSNVFDIGIDPLPVSKIDAGPDTIIYSVERIYHMNSVNPALVGETGGWSVLNNGTGKPEEVANYKTLVSNLSVGTNSFLWTVSRGNCDLKDSVKIVLLQDFEPEGFSPNGDPWNNTFIIEGLDENDNYLDLNIVNGAGTEVFSTTNRNGQKWTNWDGKNSRGLDLSEGTYYYMLKIAPKNIAGSVIKKNGFIILKRF